ncbi:MAG: phosphatidate cytidylyltransferase [Pseudomonadota bacterium]
MLKQRVITAIILFVLFLLALFGLPALLWSALVVAMVVLGAVEWARLSGLSGADGKRYLLITAVLMLLLVGFDAAVSADLQVLPHLLVYAASVVLWVFIVPVWLMTSWQLRSPWTMGVVGWVVLLPTGLAMMDLRAANPWWLLGIMALVWMADISAYFAGKRFGKHKLAPSISPGKTWEGVAGALLGVAIYVLIVAWVTGLYKQYLVFPSGVLAAWWWVGLAIIGDLFESAIKRQAGVKDSGSLLPGHGGLLDRIDALTPTLPLAALALILQRLS